MLTFCKANGKGGELSSDLEVSLRTKLTYKRRQSGDRRRIAELFQSSGVRDGNIRLPLFRAHRAANAKKAKEEKRPC